MRTALFASVLLLGASAGAGGQSTLSLDRVFSEYCTTLASPNPICDQDPPATRSHKWLLLADVCDRGGAAPGICVPFVDIREETKPCVVAYSHRRGRWRPLHTLESSGKWAYDTDANGAPSIVVSRTGDCLAIVEDTKPLTYAVQIGKVEEKENDLFAGLTDLAGVLGAALTIAADRAAAAHLTPVEGDEFKRLAVVTSALASSCISVTNLRAEVVAALNAVEVSETGALTPVDWTSARLDPVFWRDQFGGMRDARQKAVASLAGGKPNPEQGALLDQSQKLLDHRDDVVKTVAALTATRDRWSRYVIGTRMMTWMVVNLRQQPVSWTKDQVHEFKVGVDTPFASDVSTQLPKVETSIRFTSPRASMFGIGAGLVITPIEQVTYKALAGDGGVKRITATGHDSRTGQLALFVDWRLVQAWHPAASTWMARPALEGGVAIDTKTPGFFLGGSIDVTKWIRVSYGRTWQNVTVLDGQQEHDPVANDDAIKLRDTFVGGSYASVSFAIDALPLFTSK
jgi:hypothetical protein